MTEGKALTVVATMAEQYRMSAVAFETTLRKTIVPKGITPEQLDVFLMVAEKYGLNPLTREIYAMPTPGGGVQTIVGIDGWLKIVNSNPLTDGMTFTDHLDDKGNLVSITCRIHRKDRQYPTECTEYMSECKRNTPPWQQWPRRMLRHKSVGQAARYAYGFCDIIDQDEFERRQVTGDIQQKKRPTLTEQLTAIANGPTAEIPHDPETGEILEDLPSPYNTPEAPEPPTRAEIAQVEPELEVDESEPEWPILVGSAAYNRGRRDAIAKKTKCEVAVILEDGALFANWRAGYDSIAEEATP